MLMKPTRRETDKEAYAKLADNAKEAHEYFVQQGDEKSAELMRNIENDYRRRSLSEIVKSIAKSTILKEKSPPGWKGTVEAMKKHKEIDNPFALAWYMKRKGYKSHKKSKKRLHEEIGYDIYLTKEN